MPKAKQAFVALYCQVFHLTIQKFESKIVCFKFGFSNLCYLQNYREKNRFCLLVVGRGLLWHGPNQNCQRNPRGARNPPKMVERCHFWVVYSLGGVCRASGRVQRRTAQKRRSGRMDNAPSQRTNQRIRSLGKAV